MPLGTKKKSNKRKQRNITAEEDEVREYPKTARIDQFQDERKVADGSTSPWNNLELILSLQDKNIDIIKKVDLAFDYVKSSSIKDMEDITRRSQVLDTSRTIVFLNNWVQSVLISSEKKMRLEEYKTESDSSNESLLDLRCWKVLHFCLEESKNLHISLACSKDFLRVIHCIAMDASSYLKNMSVSCEGTLSGDRLQLYDVVLDCISLVFSFHGGVANENLDLWILLLDKVLEVLLKIIVDKLDGSKLGNFVLQISCYLFEPFAKFLRLHPTRKNGFRDFIEKLLEPLLQLLYVLRSSSPFCSVELRTNLSELVEEVLAQGLFHPTHIDGFLSLQSTGKYRNSSDAIVKEEKLVNKSYHKYLFDKVEKIVAKKNGLAIVGLGELLHLFVTCVSKHKGASASDTSKLSNISSTSHLQNIPFRSKSVISNKNLGFPSVDAELRKYIFDYFVQIMEYLLADVNKSLRSDWEVESVFLNVASTLKSINNLLATFIYDNLYLRTEDTSEGASKNFLRVIYDMITSFSGRISHLTESSFGSDGKSQKEILIYVQKELIVAVHHLLNIEYEVVGDDLESLWTMVLSSMSCFHSSMDVMGQSLLSPEILSLCCRLVDLYSELRQVNSSLFALCRAVRNSVSLLLDRETCVPSQFCSSFSNALSMLFCSSEFRLSLSNAIKAIPEGQAAGCIRQLSSDISESLEWTEIGHQLTGKGGISKSNPQSSVSLQFHLRAKLLGKVLSEVYTVILDSITISSGNSYLIGVSLKTLIEILRPSLSSLVALQPNTIKEIFIVVGGRTLSKSTGCDDVPMCWILVFLFHLLLSCRSLFRQAISLMPPKSSEKMSGVMGDSATSHSGKDWLEMAGFDDKGFFSWVIQPSAPLLDVVHFVSEINIQDSVVVCSPLVYILNAMALQRLVDLNRLIKSSEYMLQWNQSQSETKSKDDNDFSLYNKRIKKWKKNVSEMTKEAAGLTKFMMQFLLSIPKDQISEKIDDTLIQGQHNNCTDFSVGSLNETSLPSTLWRVICQNIDIWCSHAAKKDLKNFLTLLIQSSLPCLSNHNSKPCLKKVTEHQIALKFLSNTISYEQKFVSRYMASRFCKILQKSVQSIFSSSGIDLSMSPDWSEVISKIENLSNVQTETLPWIKPNKVLAEACSKQLNDEFASCQWLLTLWMRMPEEYLSSRSSSIYITYILNLERLLVESLLGQQSASQSHDSYQTFQLFVSCRRVLKILTVSSCNGTMNGHLSLPWLLKSISAVIGLQHAFPQDIAFEAKVAIFSLMDDTSNAFLTVSRDQFEHAISSFDSAKKLHGKRKSLDPCTEELYQSECDLLLNPGENLNAWQSVCQLAEMFNEHLQKLTSTYRDASLDQRVECSAKSQEMNKLSSIVCCGQGLLWGLASALANKNTAHNNFRIKSSSNNAGLITRVNLWIDSWMNFLTFSLKALFLEDYPTLDMSACGGNALKDREMGPSGKMEASDTKGTMVNCNFKRKSHPPIPDLEAFLSEVQNSNRCLKKSLLLEILRGENAEAGFFLQQVFIACSAILRLNLLMDLNSISWSLFPIVIDISQFLLLEFSRSEMLHQFSLIWLDGAVKFLEELGSYFPQFDPMLSRDFYVNLIGLHLRVIGKCISFQGKLAFQETGSHAKRLCEVKARLKMSFRTYVKKSSEFHLLSAIQAVERALVGVQEGLMTSYEILCGGSDGGEASAIVAAGIDCLDMILEFVTGHRRLGMIKRHIQGFVASLFNIILHLQSPTIFHANVDSIKAYASPDSGSVILMCIEVLNKILGKASFFQIDACHIASSLRAPGALFQYFLQLQISVTAFSGISKSRCAIDRKFAVELYASSCRLLCTALKHHKSETRQCIALLEDSVSILLNCLETVKIGEFFAWEVQEAVKCASSLRRVYEEVRQQKDVFAQYSFQFLSRYIWVYCGFGPAKNGIIREIDEALKPGVYALIDSCSADDLQLLHTSFGEGPCRSTLASLQHDYKLNFQFGGKV